MTAINLFVTDDAAYLAADGAIFDKVALLHGCGMAVGVAGRGGVPFFVQAFDRCGPFLSQADVRPGDAEAAARFQAIQAAYDVLRTAEERRQWQPG